MVKSIEEFREELKILKREMYKKSDTADLKLVASWLDRLVISLEGLAESLEVIDAEVDTACDCCSMESSQPAKKAQKPKASKKKRR